MLLHYTQTTLMSYNSRWLMLRSRNKLTEMNNYVSNNVHKLILLEKHARIKFIKFYLTINFVSAFHFPGMELKGLVIMYHLDQ